MLILGIVVALWLLAVLKDLLFPPWGNKTPWER